MPKGDRPSIPPMHRILARTVIDGECYRFTGCHDRSGYGRITVGSRKDGTRRLASVHIVSYEHVYGPVPAGLELDHVRANGCNWRDCWNPAHLEAVTHSTNLLAERMSPEGRENRRVWAKQLAVLGCAAKAAQ